MEGLSGFDRSMLKRLESSAMAFYELKHQQDQQQQQYREQQFRDQSICAEDGKTKTVMKYQRGARDSMSSSSSASSSSSSSTSSSRMSTRQFSSETVQTSDCVKIRCLSGRTSDTADDEDDVAVPVTMTQTELAALKYGDSSPRPTADEPTGTTSNASISFSISRILGHDNTSLRPGPVHHLSAGRSTPPVHVLEQARSQSGIASPDSSCRVAGDDLDHDVKTLNDVDSDDDELNDTDVMVKLQMQSPASAAAAAVSADTLHRLSWLQCTRYKPPKLPSKNFAVYTPRVKKRDTKLIYSCP